MIDLIYFEKKVRDEYSIETNKVFIDGFTQLNIFSGTNNSGKSMFLRSLASNNDQIRQFNPSISKDLMTNIAGRFTSNFSQSVRSLQYRNNHNEYQFLNQRLMQIMNSAKGNSIDSLKGIFEFETLSKIEIDNSELDNNILTQFENQAKEYNFGFNNIENKTPKIYIPALRGLRPLDKLEDSLEFTNRDLYGIRTRTDYFANLKTPKVETGLTIFEDIKKLLLGTTEQRRLIGDFEVFLKEFIFDVNVTLIPKYDQDVLNIKLGDDDQLPIYNLGDGLQSIITILFPVFINKDSDYEFYIEEPETHLHPHWQLKLLKAMLALPKAQYFVTSHSAAFMNNEKSSIFRFQKDKTGVFHINQINSKKSALKLIDDLGYKPSDLLMSNFNIWVEGPSDKLYFNRLIELLEPDLIEGKDYSVLILGGENYRNWFEQQNEEDLTSFESLNNNFILILDSDKSTAKSPLSQVKQKIVDSLDSDKIWVTKKREIENYIAAQVFIDSAKNVLLAENIHVDFGEYSDVTAVKIINSQVDYNSNIKLDPSIMKIVKENKGTTKGIKADKLRSLIESQLKTEKKSKVNKVRLAKYITQNYGIEAYDKSLKDRVEEIIGRIKELK